MVDVDCSVLISLGMVIQMLPEAELGAIDALESMLGNLPSLTAIGLKVKDAFPTQGDAPLDTDVYKRQLQLRLHVHGDGDHVL